MSIESGVGLSTNKDLITAVQEASQGAGADCASPKLILFLCTFNYDLGALADASKALGAKFPGAVITGGTVNGLTFGDARYDAVYANQYAVAVVAFGGNDVSIGAALEAAPTESPLEVGKRLMIKAQEGLGGAPTGGIILTPGLSNLMNFCDQELVDGLRLISPRLRVTGTGLSGGLRPEGVSDPGHAILGDRVEKMGTLLIVFGGSSRCGFSAANGLQAEGPGAFVTGAEGKFLKTLNGRPASEVIVELLSQGDEEAKGHFLQNPTVASIERGKALALPDPEGDFFWPRIMPFFTPDGGAFEALSTKKGAALALVSITPQSCMAAVKQASDMLYDDAGTREFDVVIAFSCALRGFTLGAEVAGEDIELRKHIKAKKQLGVVANGEIGSYRHGRPFATCWVYALFGLAEGR
jgi:hypothetical protein